MSFRELLANICLRPVMFVGRRDFALVAAFLDGYEFARGQPPELPRFGGWLAKWHGGHSNRVWSDNLLRLCGSDPEAALRRLPALYDEFVADLPPAHGPVTGGAAAPDGTRP